MSSTPSRDRSDSAERTGGRQQEPRSAQTQESVARALKGWQRRLVDAGGPNTLLWFDENPGGSLDLSTAHPGGVSMLMAGRATRLSDLVRERSAFAHARERAEAIQHKTVELAQERGLSAGFMAIGMATWNVPGARRAPLAPVLLRGCRLAPTDPSHRDYDIDLSAAVEINPVLAHYLSSEQGIDIDPEAVAALAHSARRFDPMPVFRELTRMCRGVPGFRIADRKIVAPFSYAKLPLVADLVAHGSTLAQSRLVAQLAEASGALEAGALKADLTPASAAQSQEPQPVTGREVLVLGTDRAQRQVVAAVRAGRDVALDAPAGTGRTQTVATVAAALVAEGKSVLVVSEAANPLVDLAERLTDLGLEQVLVRVGEGGLDRGQVAAAVRDAIDDAPSTREPDVGEVADAIGARRVRLDAHRDAMHELRQPWGVSVFDGLAALARLTRPRRPPTSRVRLSGDTLKALDPAAAARAGELLTKAATAGAWSEDRRRDPWSGARITDESARARALQTTQDLSAHELEADREALDGLVGSVGLAPARVPADWGTAIGLLEGVRDTLQVLHPEVFSIDLLPFLGATGDADYRERNDLRQSWWSRWRLRRRTRDFVRDGAAIDDLHLALVRAHEQTVTWRRLSGGASTPRVPKELDRGRERWNGLDAQLLWLAQRLPGTSEGGDLHGTALEELRARLARLAGRGDRLAVLPRVVPILDELAAMGLGPLADDLANRRVGPEFTGAEMEFVWWRSVLDEVARDDERVGGHDAVKLRQDVGDYATLDTACQRTSVETVLARHAQATRAAAAEHREQLRLVQGEASRASGHLPVDRLVQGAPELVLAARPVWLASPLVVASALPPKELFDVVIVEDAGRQDPAHVVSAFARARQVLIVGDSRQLSPRPFTTSVARPGAPAPSHQGQPAAPGLLDVLGSHLDLLTLRQHYRGFDERLVAFANDHFYDGAVQAMPGAGSAGSQAVRLVLVDPGEDEATSVVPGARAGSRGADQPLPDLRDAEADRAVDLVLNHAVMRPTESLALVGVSTEHATRLRERLRERLDAERDPDVVDFFDEHRREPVLVVPLEELAGYSRDAVILSVGIDPVSAAGGDSLGVLSRDEGERALAVALMTPRRRLTVVSAVTPDELDGRLRSRGATLLRELLEFAAREGRPALHERVEATVDFRADAPDADAGDAAGVAAGAPDEGAAGAGGDPDVLAKAPDRPGSDPVLAEFAVRLRQEGLVVRERYGEGGQPIDLVVEDPHHTGHAVVAVESDGPRYARTGDTRERELLRAARLRELGWEYVSVCSADIFADPVRDVARVLDAVRAADARSWSTRPRPRGARRAGGAGIAGRGSASASFEGVALDAVAPEPEPAPEPAPEHGGVTESQSPSVPEQEVEGPEVEGPGARGPENSTGASASARPGEGARRSTARTHDTGQPEARSGRAPSARSGNVAGRRRRRA